MRPAVVIEADPVANDATGVLQCFEATPMGTLLLQGPDDAFDHAILLRAMRRDELLLQPVTADQRGKGKMQKAVITISDILHPIASDPIVLLLRLVLMENLIEKSLFND